MNGSEAIRESTRALMSRYPNVLCLGLGVNDPGRVFGTTQGLLEEFGESRVFETPTSELALTGVGVGLALGGYRVLHSHQRLDFALLAMDQLVNSAAKWRYMFGEKFQVPYFVRMIVGRGWGQGPTHSQNLESWLAHVPGLRVIVPASPQDMFDAIQILGTSQDPAIIIEHRWLHSVEAEVETEVGPQLTSLGPLVHGDLLTSNVGIITWGLATYDALAAKARLEGLGIEAAVVQLRELDQESLQFCESRTEALKNIVVAAGTWGPSSFADSVIASLAMSSSTAKSFARVVHPFEPESTSLSHLAGYHVSDWRIANCILNLLGTDLRVPEEPPVDQPRGFNFGPF